MTAADRDSDTMPVRISGYRITRKLGQGGMSTVYLAEQRRMDRAVALKVLDPTQSADGAVRARFLREGRLGGRINHTNVVTYHELRQVQDWLFMALEYVDGGDLAGLVRERKGQLPERLALGLARDVACGLEACARAGVVHRDLKPHNIFITRDMVPKIADFSASLPSAAALQAEDPDRQAGIIVGSPGYMAPEQADGRKHLDARADIYGLGATLYHLLCGQAPFKAGNPRETLKQAMTQPPPDPRKEGGRPEVQPETSALIARCLAKDPDERYQTPRELAEALEQILHAGGAPVVPQGLPQTRSHRRETGEITAIAWESAF
jgi:serine/threonine protein kinase